MHNKEKRRKRNGDQIMHKKEEKGKERKFRVRRKKGWIGRFKVS